MIGANRPVSIHWMAAATLLGVLIASPSLALAEGSKSNWRPFKRSKVQTPTRIMLMTTPAPVETIQQSIVQGFMVRAYFFRGDNPEPVQVAGNLLFTVTDPKTAAGQAGQHNGIFQIPGDQLAKHFRPDVLGDSYLFWLPYDPPESSNVIVEARFLAKGEKEILDSGVNRIELMPADRAVAEGNGRLRLRTENHVVQKGVPAGAAPIPSANAPPPVAAETSEWGQTRRQTSVTTIPKPSAN